MIKYSMRDLYFILLRGLVSDDFLCIRPCYKTSLAFFYQIAHKYVQSVFAARQKMNIYVCQNVVHIQGFRLVLV